MLNDGAWVRETPGEAATTIPQHEWHPLTSRHPARSPTKGQPGMESISGKPDLARQKLTETRRDYPAQSVRLYRDEGDHQPGPETDRFFEGLALAALSVE